MNRLFVMSYLLDSIGMFYEIECNVDKIMKESKGLANPEEAKVGALWVVWGGHRKLFMYPWDLIDFINKEGIRYACGGR